MRFQYSFDFKNFTEKIRYWYATDIYEIEDYNGSNVKTKIWWEFNEPDISKSFCYATHVVKAE